MSSKIPDRRIGERVRVMNVASVHPSFRNKTGKVVKVGRRTEKDVLSKLVPGGLIRSRGDFGCVVLMDNGVEALVNGSCLAGLQICKGSTKL